MPESEWRVHRKFPHIMRWCRGSPAHRCSVVFGHAACPPPPDQLYPPRKRQAILRLRVLPLTQISEGPAREAINYNNPFLKKSKTFIRHLRHLQWGNRPGPSLRSSPGKNVWSCFGLSSLSRSLKYFPGRVCVQPRFPVANVSYIDVPPFLLLAISSLNLHKMFL